MNFTLEQLRAAQRLIGSVPPPIRLVESDLLTVGPFEDWSDVRSPSRAKRRRARGHKQRIRLFFKPDPKLYRLDDGMTVGHPAVIATLRTRLRTPEPRQ